MSSIVHAKVSVPYRASVVPKGGRNARIEAFRMDVPVAFGLLDEAPPVAVRCRDGFGNQIDYLGHGGSLYLPVMSDWGRDVPPLTSDTVLRHFARGEIFRSQVSASNPFAVVGIHRMVGLSLGPFTKSIEDAHPRSVQWDERSEAQAAAQRVAREFLLVGDGRVLRRSPGPVWGCIAPGRLDLCPLTYEESSTLPAPFSCLRRAEAVEWFGRETGRAPGTIRGTVDVLIPEHVADHDAEAAARQVLRRAYAGWIGCVEPLATPSVGHLAREAANGLERLHGMDMAALRDKSTQSLPRPVEAERLFAAEIVSAVESMRLFVAEMPGEIGDPEVEKVCSNWRAVFEDLSGLAMRRFDDFEAPRLLAAYDVPDIAVIPSPTPGH